MNFAERSKVEPDRRCSPRVDVDGLVFVNLQDSIFLLDLSERGMSIQAMDVLEPGRSFSFAFPMPGTSEEARGLAQIVWTDRAGRAGLMFTYLSDSSRSWVKQQLSSVQN